MRIMVEVTDDGRIKAPPGMRLTVLAQATAREDGTPTSDEKEELQALWDEINADADSIALKPWPEGDPIVEKYRRKGLID